MSGVLLCSQGGALLVVHWGGVLLMVSGWFSKRGVHLSFLGDVLWVVFP